MLSKCCIGIGVELRFEPCEQSRSFPRWASWNGFGFDIAGRASQLEIALDLARETSNVLMIAARDFT